MKPRPHGKGRGGGTRGGWMEGEPREKTEEGKRRQRGREGRNQQLVSRVNDADGQGRKGRRQNRGC